GCNLLAIDHKGLALRPRRQLFLWINALVCGLCARIKAVGNAGYRIIDENILLGFAARRPLTNRFQRLLTPGAPFAIAIKLRLILADNLIAVAERLDRLRSSRRRIGRALHHFAEDEFGDDGRQDFESAVSRNLRIIRSWFLLLSD